MKLSTGALLVDTKTNPKQAVALAGQLFCYANKLPWPIGQPIHESTWPISWMKKCDVKKNLPDKRKF